MQPIILVTGTRPDAIKIIPLYLELKHAGINVLLISTGQHGILLNQVLELFNIKPDISLDIMIPGQDLFYLTTIILQKLKDVYIKNNPQLVLVHGDTTTAFASALAAFYLNIPIGHIEAGVRSFNINAPFPEEANRKLIACISTLHFAPTQHNVENLIKEGISSKIIFKTGNTVTDALRIVKEKIKNNELKIDSHLLQDIEYCKKNNKKIIFFTTHRRESFGPLLDNLLNTIKEYALSHADTFIIFPAHPNPNIKQSVEKSKLSTIDNIKIYNPLTYQNSVYLLENCNLVLTDSGGLQEEASALLKHTIVLRNETDRPESIKAGIATSIGLDCSKIIDSLNYYLYTDSPKDLAIGLYGNGYSAKIIVNIIKTYIKYD